MNTPKFSAEDSQSGSENRGFASQCEKVRENGKPGPDCEGRCVRLHFNGSRSLRECIKSLAERIGG